ncbi:hypothetical protein [Heyndrickxia acidiproducens]|uniref:hypothetical protein n=1 Tax=Heyndrickxia acidiproducens TaxID=1121084 RepID=UPI000378FC29|nr:hypothetical protein [Heyndrickxia acidiproducens]
MKLQNLFVVLYKPRQIITTNLKSNELFFPILIIGVISSILYTVFASQSIDQTMLGINFKSVSPLLIIFSLLIGFLSPFISIIINSIINYITILITGIYIEFKSLMVIGIFSYVPVLIELLLKVIFSFFSGKYFTNFFNPLAGLFNNQHQILQILSSSISITGLWSLLIYILGVIILLKSNDGKVNKLTITLVVIVNLALTVMVAALTTITGDLKSVLN